MNSIPRITNNLRSAPYTSGTAQMWVDDYISTQLLQVHLDQNIGSSTSFTVGTTSKREKKSIGVVETDFGGID